MYKKILSLLLCAVLVAGLCSVSASAAIAQTQPTGITSPRYAYLSYSTAELSLSGKTATIEGNILGLSSVTKISYTVSLQEKSGSSWKDVSTWSDSSNSRSATYSYSKSITHGKTYRNKTVATVYSGSQSESVTAYSAEKVG